MDRRYLDIVFVAAVVILSYIASVHLITGQVVEQLQANQQVRRIQSDREPLLGGPIALRPIPRRRNQTPVLQKVRHVQRERLALRHPASRKKKKKPVKIGSYSTFGRQ